jgi:hypothetical protein
LDFAKPAEVAGANNVSMNTALQMTIVEAREIEHRTAAVDSRVEALFSAHRLGVRDVE